MYNRKDVLHLPIKRTRKTKDVNARCLCCSISIFRHLWMDGGKLGHGASLLHPYVCVCFFFSNYIYKFFFSFFQFSILSFSFLLSFCSIILWYFPCPFERNKKVELPLLWFLSSCARLLSPRKNSISLPNLSFSDSHNSINSINSIIWRSSLYRFSPLSGLTCPDRTRQTLYVYLIGAINHLGRWVSPIALLSLCVIQHFWFLFSWSLWGLPFKKFSGMHIRSITEIRLCHPCRTHKPVGSCTPPWEDPEAASNRLLALAPFLRLTSLLFSFPLCDCAISLWRLLACSSQTFFYTPNQRGRAACPRGL